MAGFVHMLRLCSECRHYVPQCLKCSQMVHVGHACVCPAPTTVALARHAAPAHGAGEPSAPQGAGSRERCRVLRSTDSSAERRPGDGRPDGAQRPLRNGWRLAGRAAPLSPAMQVGMWEANLCPEDTRRRWQERAATDPGTRVGRHLVDVLHGHGLMVSLLGDDGVSMLDSESRDVCWVLATVASLAEQGGYTMQQLHDLSQIWRPLGATRLDVWAALLRRAGCRLRLLYVQEGQLLELDRPWLRGDNGAALITAVVAAPVAVELTLNVLAATDLWAERAHGPVGNGVSKGWGRAPGHVSPADDYLQHVMALMVCGHAPSPRHAGGEWQARVHSAGPGSSHAHDEDGPPRQDSLVAAVGRQKRAKHRHAPPAVVHHVVAVTDYMIPWQRGDATMDDPASVEAPAGAGWAGPTLEHVGHSPSIALDMPPGGSLYLGAHTRGSAAPVPANSDLAVVCISRGSADGLEDTYTLTVLCPGALTASTLASGVGAAQGDVMAAGARLTLHDGARLRFAPRGAAHHDRAGYVCILQRYGAAIWQPLPREIDPEHTFLTAPLTAQVRDALELRSSWDVDTPLFGDVGAEDEQDQFEREGLVSSSTGAALPLYFFMDEHLTIRMIVDHIRDNSGPYLTLERHRASSRAARAAHAAAARTH